MNALLLLNGLSPTENLIFGAVMTVLAVTLATLILIAARRRRAAASPEAKPVCAAVERPAVPKRDEKTMDEHFARAHGQWVCSYCETLNDETLNTCRACGQRRG